MNLSKHLGTWFLELSAKSTSTICHILLRTRAVCNFFHDAARIGNAVKVGTAELGLTLSCKSTLLANDKSLGKLIVSHLRTDGVPIGLGAAATDLGIETAAGKRRCAACQWKRIWKGRRRAKRVNRLCKMNSEAQKLTMTGIHLVQIYGHTAQGAYHAQVNAMCRSLKLGTVLGKTHARPVSTVAWFFGAARDQRVDFDVRKKAPMLADTRWQCHSGRRFVQQGADHRQFLQCMEMQTWKTAARHSSSSGLERGIITDFARKARSQLMKEGSFMARALDFLVCGAINEPHLPADGSIPNQFLCVRCDQKVLATRKHEQWECPGNTLINHTHMKESEYLTSLAQEFWDTDQVLFARGLLPRDWLPASELAECNEVCLGRISGKSENSPNTETGRIWCGHFRHAHSQRHILHFAAFWLLGRSGGRPNSGEPSKFSAESMGRRTSKFRSMRNT